MNEAIIRRLAALLNVKSIITIILTAAFAYLTVNGVVSGQEFITVYSIIITFYFVNQSQKTREKTEGEDK